MIASLISSLFGAARYATRYMGGGRLSLRWLADEQVDIQKRLDEARWQAGAGNMRLFQQSLRSAMAARMRVEKVIVCGWRVKMDEEDKFALANMVDQYMDTFEMRDVHMFIGFWMMDPQFDGNVWIWQSPESR
ncbi:MAG TPA: hypothetical protein QF873_04060 [Patescibacteria group bacterium]|nr:hypothetical protein [Patescibacteria group bacterium]